MYSNSRPNSARRRTEIEPPRGWDAPLHTRCNLRRAEQAVRDGVETDEQAQFLLMTYQLNKSELTADICQWAKEQLQ